MSITPIPPIYDELVDALTEDVVPGRMLAFQLSSEKQQQLDELLAKNRAGNLSQAEAAELDAYAHFEHVVRMLKARALQTRQS